MLNDSYTAALETKDAKLQGMFLSINLFIYLARRISFLHICVFIEGWLDELVY